MARTKSSRDLLIALDLLLKGLSILGDTLQFLLRFFQCGEVGRGRVGTRERGELNRGLQIRVIMLAKIRDWDAAFSCSKAEPVKPFHPVCSTGNLCYFPPISPSNCGTMFQAHLGLTGSGRVSPGQRGLGDSRTSEVEDHPA